jgi:Tol biopolymer transport system component
VPVALLVAAALLSGCSTPPSAPVGSPATSAPVASTDSPAPSTEASAPASASPIPSAATAGRIVFARLLPAKHYYGLFTVNPDGTGLKELLPNWDYGLDLPRWAWRGDLILARTKTPTILPLDVIKHIHLETTASVTLACAAWSPDSMVIACDGMDPAKAGREGVYAVPSRINALTPWTHERIDIGTPTRLTTPPARIHDIPGDYSADGRLVFVRTTYSVLGLGEIWIANADGTNAHKVTDTLSTYRVAWSHDGRWIVGERSGVLEVFDLQDLTADPVKIEIPGGKATEPRFSPDSTRIVFVFTKTGAKTTSIESVTLAGTDLVQITSGQLDRSPDWGAPGF